MAKRQVLGDINLPDEQAGKPVGKLPYGAKSMDPLKRRYMASLRKRVPESEVEERSRTIFGGDADDPRWDEHLGRRLQYAKTDEEAQAANADIEDRMRGGKSFYDPTRTDVSPAVRRLLKRRAKPTTLGGLHRVVERDRTISRPK